MSLRVCGEPGCAVLIPPDPEGNYCEAHRRWRKLAPRKQRGYGPEHDRLRKHWTPIVESGKVVCGKCDQLIAPESDWDLGHVEGDRRRYAGPQHVSCNRAKGRGPETSHRR